MSQTALATAFATELRHQLSAAITKIRHCLDQLSDEQCWWRPDASQNSIGNLLLHLRGNLSQWVLAGVGDAQYDRDRDAEFAADPTTGKESLFQLLAETVELCDGVIATLSATEMLREVEVQGFHVTKLGALHHSIPHFVGHTHQIVLLTRLQLGDAYRFAWTPEGDRDRVPM